jgi:transposase
MEALLMSQKERKRLVVLEQVARGQMSLVQAAQVMRVCYRQARRIWRRYQEGGDGGLVHRGRGRAGNRRKAAKTKERVLERYAQRYPDFGPTLAAEKLSAEGLKVDHETLRRWLMAQGQWTVRRRRQKHRQWRERKACFGEMVQLDGSHHDWFEGRGPRAVLMVMIDDATSKTYAQLFAQETTRASFDLMEQWSRRYGLPQRLYVDRDSIYRCERVATVKEQLAGEEPQTQFGRAMKQLGVGVILANSPQAKGRVERRNAVFQDRLVKELRRGINEVSQGHRYLRKRFCQR